jgi:putative spermidine/putrescine transport system substrate-binding protein
MRLAVAGWVGLFLAIGWCSGDAAQALAQGSIALPADAAGPMVIVGWGGISNKFGQELFSDPFAAATGSQVQWVAAPSQQVAALQAQLAAGQMEWDVANALVGEQLVVLSQLGLLRKLPPDLKARLAQKMPNGITDYGVEYATVSDVIACNSKEVTVCPKTPQDFFDVNGFPGRRSLYVGAPLVAMAMALEADGVPPDRVFPMDIDRAFRKLQLIRPNIRVFWQSGDQSEQIFRSGEVGASLLWNGRARDLAMHLTERMSIEVSWQGAIYEPAFTVMINGAPHPNAAVKYLQWLVDHPDAMAGYSERTSYGFPSLQLFKLLPDDIAQWLPEYPAHFSGQVRLDYSWYLQHRGEIDSRWKEFTSAR